VGDGNSLENINSSFSHDPRRDFGDSVVINNRDRILAVDRLSGSPPSYRLNIWGTEGYSTKVVTTGSSGFAAIANQADLNNGDLVAYSAQVGSSTWRVVTSGPSYLGDGPSAQRPAITDDGRVLVRSEIGNTSSIALIRPDASGSS